MAQFVAFSGDVEVNGETVRSVIDGMGAFKLQAKKLLAQHGIPDPLAGRWYPQQAWLDAFRAISEKLGDATLFAIGKAIPRNAKFPPGVDSLGKALASIDAAYRMNHRGGDIGRYVLKRTGECAAVVICENPYPCEFDRGIVSAMTERFRPKGCSHKARVRHDPEAGCRKRGGERCVFRIAW